MSLILSHLEARIQEFANIQRSAEPKVTDERVAVDKAMKRLRESSEETSVPIGRLMAILNRETTQRDVLQLPGLLESAAALPGALIDWPERSHKECALPQALHVASAK